MDDLINRQAVLKKIGKIRQDALMMDDIRRAGIIMTGMNLLEKTMRNQPSAQPERDIPIKPYETTDTAWGISVKQAVCPKCNYYLGHVVFLGDGKGKKVTYCETCGQAIDWEGWDFENEQT